MKLLFLLALGATVPFVAPVGAPRTAHVGMKTADAPTRLSGVAMAVHQGHSKSVITIRTGKGTFATLVPRSDSAVVTADGKPLGVKAIELGDRLDQTQSGSIRDQSQRSVNLRGIISIAPLQATDPITVQLHDSWAIIADANSATLYTDRSHQTSTWAQLQDSDLVEIDGLYDSTAGEMTNVTHVTRLGPFAHSNRRAATSHA